MSLTKLSTKQLIKQGSYAELWSNSDKIMTIKIYTADDRFPLVHSGSSDIRNLWEFLTLRNDTNAE